MVWRSESVPLCEPVRTKLIQIFIYREGYFVEPFEGIVLYLVRTENEPISLI